MTPEDEEFARIDAEIKRRQPVSVKTYHDGKPWPVAPKPWMGLTYQEQKDIINNSMTPVCVVIATEAKLREKNGGAA